MRDDFAQVVLDAPLRDALARLNPQLPPDKRKKATTTVLQQAELVWEMWVSSP